MGKYSNVTRAEQSSFIGGVKGRFYFKEASAFSACPQFATVKDTDAKHSTLEGAFVFKDESEVFNYVDIMTESGELKWTAVGSKGNKKSKLEKMFSVAGLPDSLYKLVEQLNKGEDIICILELADCGVNNKIMFGGCCYPANLETYEGTTGKTGENDVATVFTLTTYAGSLPPKLPLNIEIPIEIPES